MSASSGLDYHLKPTLEFVSCAIEAKNDLVLLRRDPVTVDSEVTRFLGRYRA